MLDTAELSRIVVNEFASQYPPDEMPPEWDREFLESRLPRMAAASAARLRHRVGRDNLGALAGMVEAAAADPQDPLADALCGVNMVDWQDTPGGWRVLQRLLGQIRQDLRAEPASVPTEAR